MHSNFSVLHLSLAAAGAEEVYSERTSPGDLPVDQGEQSMFLWVEANGHGRVNMRYGIMFYKIRVFI